jgi:hypothetical protein
MASRFLVGQEVPTSGAGAAPEVAWNGDPPA